VEEAGGEEEECGGEKQDRSEIGKLEFQCRDEDFAIPKFQEKKKAFANPEFQIPICKFQKRGATATITRARET